MKNFFNQIEKSISTVIVLSYITMTLVVSFHIHTVDLIIPNIAKIEKTESNQEEATSFSYNKCLFIHQASNIVQFIENNVNHLTGLTLFSIQTLAETNSFSFGKIRLSLLRAPPLFS